LKGPDARYDIAYIKEVKRIKGFYVQFIGLCIVNAFILILFLTGYGDEVFLAMANLEYRFLLGGIGLACTCSCQFGRNIFWIYWEEK
jgi:hypothetical protein